MAQPHFPPSKGVPAAELYLTGGTPSTKSHIAIFQFILSQIKQFTPCQVCQSEFVVRDYKILKVFHK